MVDLKCFDLVEEKELTRSNKEIKNNRFDKLLNVLNNYTPQAIELRSRKVGQSHVLLLFEKRQREAFMHVMNKKYEDNKEDWLELFDMFFRDLLDNKTTSIIKWLKDYFNEPAE